MKALIALATLLAATAVALDESPPASPPAAHIQTDKEIESAVVKGIVANPEVFAARLRVEAVGGVVTLRGSVKSKDAKATADKVARAVPGVREVKNRLTVRRPIGVAADPAND